jgi:hypothetical protein
MDTSCPKCDAQIKLFGPKEVSDDCKWKWDVKRGQGHNELVCVQTQLDQANLEIKKLKSSIDSWKDAWFHLREIIGNLWWHHPAIDNDEARAYYQAHLTRIKENKS